MFKGFYKSLSATELFERLDLPAFYYSAGLTRSRLLITQPETPECTVYDITDTQPHKLQMTDGRNSRDGNATLLSCALAEFSSLMHRELRRITCNEIS